jgi:hypothetical protein
MVLVLALPAPRIQRVVHHHAVARHLVVVGEGQRQAERDGVQAGGLRREVQARGVGAAHDRGELCKVGSSTLYFDRNASKLHSSPTCDISTSGMS